MTILLMAAICVGFVLALDAIWTITEWVRFDRRRRLERSVHRNLTRMMGGPR